MSLHQLHTNKNNISFKSRRKAVLPATCDTIIRNLIGNPKRHLDLINRKDIIKLFDKSTHKTIKIRKMESRHIKGLSVSIHQLVQIWRPSQLTDFLDKIDKQAARVDGCYTMQPIVTESISNGENVEWGLLKGQNRITSIYMTLKYLESNNLKLNTCKSSSDLLNKYFLNTVNYKDWDDFLQDVQGTNSFMNDTLNKTYQTLHNWFSKKTAVEQEIWKRKLLNHTKFIWYVAEDDCCKTKNTSEQSNMLIEAKYLS